ncbi:MAG: DUF4922 domain-containing protein [Bacteroidota bacterium]
MLNEKIQATYDPQQHFLPALVSELHERQQKTWPQLADGISALSAAQVRAVECDGFSVQLQWNPQRIGSTAARVDESSIRERKCFLCVENLPAAQLGILYQKDFVILCNPAPIFPTHLTISHVKHVHQAIDPALELFLDIARDLGPKCSVFYNGPKCGASAPDHLHFQASTKNAIPVEIDVTDARRRHVLQKSAEVALLSLKRYGRSTLVFESTNRDELSATLRKLFSAWKNNLRISEEPMLNMICSYRELVWRVVLFPRAKHRPAVFFKEGDERVLVSPAAVDMGGFVVTPVERDFRGLTPGLIQEIFQEVSLESNRVEEIVKMMKS